MKHDTLTFPVAKPTEESIDTNAIIATHQSQEDNVSEMTLSDLAAAMQSSRASQDGSHREWMVDELVGRLDQILERQEHATFEDERLREVYAECRSLRERQHEQEVLLPILRTLIRIADRTRHEVALLKRSLSEHDLHSAADLVPFARQLIAARKADLVEIEATLSLHGVTIYQHPSVSFSPRVQTCIKPIPTGSRKRDQRIATRVLPGYRKSGIVIQPERVAVHAYDDSARKQGAEE